jgi:AAA+ ATPase superfamily predicted ATPase
VDAPRFLNRHDELAALQDHWERPEASFFVVWGRRRVGKTELLAHFARTRRSLYLEATDTTERNQLAALSAELSAASGNPLYAQAPLPSWAAALTAVAELARGSAEPLLVVLDEFQYLAGRQPELPTLLNRWWRETGRSLPLMLVIAGSALSFFRDEVLAGRMYGRRTGQLAVRPFDHAAAALFAPGRSPADLVRTYAVCGGMPYYLQAFDDAAPLADHILRHVLYRDGFLHEEAELLLRQELAEPRAHVAVLEAVASGRTRTSEVANATGLGASQASQVLGALERLELVAQRRPVTASPSSKKTSWAIVDGFLSFCFRFVEPYRSRLRTREEARRHLAGTVMPQLDHFVSKPAWEAICLEHMHRAERAATAGAWWGKVRVAPRRTEEREVDGATLDDAGNVTALASCKWTSSPMGVAEAAYLTEMQQHIPGAEGARRLYLYSRSGFGARLARLAEEAPDRYRLLTPADVYAQTAA